MPDKTLKEKVIEATRQPQQDESTRFKSPRKGFGSLAPHLSKLGTPTTDSDFQKRYNEASGPTEKGQVLVEYSNRYPELFSTSSWVKTALADSPHMREHNQTKKAKTLTPSEIDSLLKKARQEQSPVDWGILTDEQEKCARLRWQCYIGVSMIARSLGKHRTTVDELLARAKARLDPAGNVEQLKKKGIVP